MSKSDVSASKKESRKTIRWVVTIFLVTILSSGCISFLSDIIMDSSSIVVAFIILFAIVLVGILFDIIGMAVASADEKPFHSMAARKVKGAQECIRLLRKAERVSSICNDVIGDICGVVSGVAAATIATQLILSMDFAFPQLLSLILSSLVAGLTVGGKALGKKFAINSCTKIVYAVGRFISAFHREPEKRKK